MKCIDSLKKAYEVYKANPAKLSLITVLMMALQYVLGIVMLLAALAVVAAALLLYGSGVVGTGAVLAGNIAALALLIGTALILLALALAAVVLNTAITGALFELCYRALQGRDFTLTALLERAAAKWQTYGGIGLAKSIIEAAAFLLIVGVPIGLVIVLAMFVPQLALIVAFIPLLLIILVLFALIVYLVLYVFFSMSYPAAVVKKAGVLSSLKLSVSTVFNNLIDVFVLLVICFLVNLFLCVIPIVGGALAILVWMPISAIALIDLFAACAGREE